MILRFILFSFFFTLAPYAYAKCDFIVADHIRELHDPRAILGIDIDVAKSGKYARNALKSIIHRSNNIPPELRKNFWAQLKVKYEFGTCSYRAKIRQNGDWKDHIKLSKDGGFVRSLVVKLLDGNILNAVRFKLLIPSTRGGVNEIMATVIMREMGYIAPETFFTQVSVNGNTNLMLFQEDTRKELIERHSRREGPIFEGDESLLWNEEGRVYLDNISLARIVNSKWIIAGRNAAEIALKAYGQLQSSYINSFSDRAKKFPWINPNSPNDLTFPKFQILSAAMSAAHGLGAHNRKFYYNSFEQKFEPIYYDGNANFELKNFETSFDSNLLGDVYGTLPIEIWDSLIIDQKTANSILFEYRKRITSDTHAKHSDYYGMLNNFQRRLTLIKKEHLLQSPDSRHELNSDEQRLLITSYINKVQVSEVEQKHVRVVGLTRDRVYINQSNLETNQINYDELKKLVSKLLLSNSRAVFLGETSTSKTYKIEAFPKPFGGYVFHSLGTTWSIKPEEKKIVINQTNSDDWILISNSKINNWQVEFNGAIPSRKDSIFGERINLNGLTGCLNFYKVDFIGPDINVRDGGCEDSINIVSSTGNISGISVARAFSDAIDFDFSDIRVDTLTVKLAGNDCLDVSGGNYEFDYILAENCSDKAISVGEKSQFKTSKTDIKTAIDGVVAKDYSHVVIDKLNATNVKYCLKAEMKKQEFGGAKLVANDIACNGIIHADTGSIIQEQRNEF